MVITIRHDGAKPHNGKGNKEFFEKWGRKYGWIFEFETQSPQSPDVNVLDIGVFNGLQAKSDEYRMNSSKVLDMVARIRRTFYNYPWQQLDNCFAVLHEHYRSIRMCEGGNKYPDPHCGIRRRVAAGEDPVNYSIHFDDGYDSEDNAEA